MAPLATLFASALVASAALLVPQAAAFTNGSLIPSYICDNFDMANGAPQSLGMVVPYLQEDDAMMKVAGYHKNFIAPYAAQDLCSAFIVNCTEVTQTTTFQVCAKNNTQKLLGLIVWVQDFPAPNMPRHIGTFTSPGLNMMHYPWRGCGKQGSTVVHTTALDDNNPTPQLSAKMVWNLGNDGIAGTKVQVRGVCITEGANDGAGGGYGKFAVDLPVTASLHHLPNRISIKAFATTVSRSFAMTPLTSLVATAILASAALLVPQTAAFTNGSLIPSYICDNFDMANGSPQSLGMVVPFLQEDDSMMKIAGYHHQHTAPYPAQDLCSAFIVNGTEVTQTTSFSVCAKNNTHAIVGLIVWIQDFPAPNMPRHIGTMTCPGKDMMLYPWRGCGKMGSTIVHSTALGDGSANPAVSAPFTWTLGNDGIAGKTVQVRGVCITEAPNDGVGGGYGKFAVDLPVTQALQDGEKDAYEENASWQLSFPFPPFKATTLEIRLLFHFAVVNPSLSDTWIEPCLARPP
ncbi:hypothetical protein HDU93_009300 [Gonapodya sp. JEL0774]|nr:hypothetical protein HDU93_009300 [Gonapodya sp. JEL0774]